MTGRVRVSLRRTVVAAAVWLGTGAGWLSAQTEADTKAYQAGRSGGNISSSASESERRAFNRGQSDAEADAQSQVDAARRGAESQAAVDATRAKLARTRAIVVKQPPLPDARNPLLGRWVQVSPAPGEQGLTQLLTNPDGAACSQLFGGDQFEYRPTELVLGDAGGDIIADKVQYRAGKDGAVFVLGDRLVSILLFEFDGRDRAKMMGCTYARVTGAAAAPAAVAEGARSYPGAGFAVAGAKLGVDAPGAVSKQITARGGTAATSIGASDAPGPLRLYGRDADYRDVGQGIYSVAYDFDRDAPTGQLIAVTLIYPGSVAGLGQILHDRAAALASKYALPAPSSSARYEGVVNGVRVTLVQDATASAVLETWAVGP